MSEFQNFESHVLHLLVAPKLGTDTVDAVVREGQLVSYNYSGSGYFLTIAHPILPTTRIVCSEPQVVGRAGNIHSGFIVFIENGELTLECHTWGEIDVPENFRKLSVAVAAT
ncbi:MAG: hypothetical protein Q7U94_04175 [Sideroxyarcus sp.]|nr:hypothetical protein [Sideroxyarcus sp.]